MNEPLLTILLAIILCLFWACFVLLVTIEQKQREIDRLKARLVAVEGIQAGSRVLIILGAVVTTVIASLRKNKNSKIENQA